MDKKERGQVLLIVVLIMIVALTVGLSIASRSITSLRLSEEEILAKKALSAAEAGIEQAIQNNASIANSSFPTAGTSFDTQVTEVKGVSFLLNGGSPILQDEGADLWLSDYSDDRTKRYENPWSGTLTLYWGDTPSSCNVAALEVQVVSESKTSPKLTRYAFDPCSGRKVGNHFTQATSLMPPQIISGNSFYYSATINILSGLIGRISPLYQNGVFAVYGNPPLPSQGFVFDSTGTSGTTQRKVTLFKGHQQLTNQNFSYGLFAP